MGTTFKSGNQVQESKMGKNEIPSVTTISKKETSPEKKGFWHINRGALPFKIHFFFFIGGMGASLPFQSVLGITRFGLTASNLAAAFTTQQFLFLLCKPAIGYLADYFNKLKATIIGLTIIHAVFYFFMIIIPETDVVRASRSQNFESNVSTGEPYNCLLCDIYHDFGTVNRSHSIEEETALRTCFQYPESFQAEDVKLQCFQQNSSPELSIYLLYATCNSTLFGDMFMSKNLPSQPDGTLSNFLYISQSHDVKQATSLACVTDERLPLLEIYGDLDFLGKYCRGISGNVSLPTTEQHFQGSQPKPEKCGISSTPVDEAQRLQALSSANFKTYQFWLFSACLTISCMAASSIFTISDTACYESLQGGRVDYGRQRAWGAVSWGLIAPVAGYLNDYMDSYLAAWCLMLAMFLFEFWNLTKMDLVKPDFSGSILKDLKEVFNSVEFLAFEAGVFMNGMFTGVIWFYLTWYLTMIGGNKLVIGLAHTIQCFFGEVPMMFISGWMIKKFGHFNIVSLALLCHGIRFFAYSYISNPWWVLPLETLHGFTFGSFYSAMTSYGKLNSKPGIEATTQSVLCTTYEALGAGIGCLVAGVCFDRLGLSRTFHYASYLCALTTLINVTSTVFIKCRQGGINVTKPAVSQRY